MLSKIFPKNAKSFKLKQINQKSMKITKNLITTIIQKPKRLPIIKPTHQNRTKRHFKTNQKTDDFLTENLKKMEYKNKEENDPKKIQKRVEEVTKILIESPKTETGTKLKENEIIRLLENQTWQEDEYLFKFADSIARRVFDNKVYFRGIIEFSNICQKNCFYCGIRKGNPYLKRFTMTREEILECVDKIHKLNFGCLLLQSGELTATNRMDYLVDLIKEIKKMTTNEQYPQGIGVVLSLGELSYSDLKRLKEAGAMRYLLRIESSNRELYEKIHPKNINHSFDTRLQCLQDLRKLSYQVGTGVMIGIPDQTLKDLANDVLFFKEMDIDMLGMGPYIPAKNTPMGDKIFQSKTHSEIQKDLLRSFQLTLRMYAISRVMMNEINIASTTALHAIHPFGREIALSSGANVMMPIVTPQNFREEYDLYDGKSKIDEIRDNYLIASEKRVQRSGKSIKYGAWNNPPHFDKRQKN